MEGGLMESIYNRDDQLGQVFECKCQDIEYDKIEGVGGSVEIPIELQEAESNNIDRWKVTQKRVSLKRPLSFFDGMVGKNNEEQNKKAI